jgi:hypothetical protein
MYMPNGGTVRFITGGTMRRLHNEFGEMRDEFMERTVFDAYSVDE